ncbi:hypothetical protein GGI05_006341, partial [Coemansia sp. RSA 2603]
SAIRIQEEALKHKVNVHAIYLPGKENIATDQESHRKLLPFKFSIQWKTSCKLKCYLHQMEVAVF